MSSKPPRSRKSKSTSKSTSRSARTKSGTSARAIADEESDQRRLEDEALDIIQGSRVNQRAQKGDEGDRPSRSKRKKPKKTRSKSNSSQSKIDKPKRPSKSRVKKKTRRKSSKSKRSNTATVLLRFGLSAVFGVTIGVLFCAYATYEAAKHDVQEWIVPSPTAEGLVPAQVWSDSYALEINARISKEQLIDILLASGYSKVATVEESGDFQVLDGALLIDNRLDSAPIQERVRVSFSEGRVQKIANASGVSRSSLTLAPMLLSKLSSGQSIQDRTPLSDIPKIVPQSILAMEDSRFYQHEGVDVIGLTRAIVVNLILDRKSQGASTITQQLVKNLILNNPEKTYKRKAREALRALALEQRLSKDQLIELYMNEVYLGQVNGRAVVGVTQAAKVYFGKKVQRLTIGEAAMIAGIISAPNAYSPLRHPEKAKQRRDVSLKRLKAVGVIDDSQLEEELNKELNIQVIPERRRANYYVDAIQDVVEKELGEGSIAAKGLQVHSTLNPVYQAMLEASVDTQIAKVEKKYPKANGVQIAAVVLDGQTGSVRAMVGGRSYSDSQFNRAMYTKREVGSLSKPLLVAQLFQYNSDLSPGCWLKDEALEIEYDGKVWSPSNYDHQFKGPITIRDTIKQSRNLPTVMMYQHLQETLGERSFQKFGKEMGLDIGLEPAVSLGAFAGTVVDMASAYTIFTDAGMWNEANFIDRIADRSGENVEWVSPQEQRIISAPVSSMVRDILQDVVSGGTAKSASKYGAKGALGAKTGTTNGGRDAWLVGFDDDVVVAVWVGFDKGKSMGLGGSQAALPIWADWMASKGGSRPVTFDTGRFLVERSVCLDWELCETEDTDLFQKSQYQGERCALFEVEEEPEGLIERIIPTRKDDESDTTSEEGGFFRLFGWGKRN